MNTEQLRELADYLNGACHTLREGILAVFGKEVTEEEEGEILRRLDQGCDILLCDECGWWTESSDTSDGVCFDCHDYNDEATWPEEEDEDDEDFDEDDVFGADEGYEEEDDDFEEDDDGF